MFSSVFVVSGSLIWDNCALLLNHPDIFFMPFKYMSMVHCFVIIKICWHILHWVAVLLDWLKVTINFYYTCSGKGSETCNTPRGKMTNTIGQILTCKYFLKPGKTMVNSWLVSFIVDGILRWLNFQTHSIFARPHISFNLAFILQLPRNIIILTFLGYIKYMYEHMLII